LLRKLITNSSANALNAGKAAIFPLSIQLRLPNVLERQGLSLYLIFKLDMFFIIEKLFVVLENFPASLKVLE